jgi:hypothetical protein
METSDLFEFIETHVPNLTDLEIIVSGIGYHYTMHKDSIEKRGKFLGRVVDENLDRTQKTLKSIKATDEKGIVCAYPDLSFAVAEGKLGNCHIYEIQFSDAIAAYHQQEFEYASSLGYILPKTIFILAHKIINFRLLGMARELKM